MSVALRVGAGAGRARALCVLVHGRGGSPEDMAGFARAVGEYGSVIFIAGNMPMRTEIAPLLIVARLEAYDYAGASALVAPLPDTERARARFPSKIADYLLSGRPVVSSRVGEVAELLRDGESAFLADPKDPDGLADALARALKSDDADAVGERRAQNQPGTDLEYPNWKVPLGDPTGRTVLLDELFDNPRLRSLAAVMRGA